nr:MAG TPA: hypothetical protein [Caudoviricetes sp.]
MLSSLFVSCIIVVSPLFISYINFNTTKLIIYLQTTK